MCLNITNPKFSPNANRTLGGELLPDRHLHVPIPVSLAS